MNKTELKNIIANDIVPYLKEQGFYQKHNFYVRNHQGRQDVIEFRNIKTSNARHIAFSFALGFIAPLDYQNLTGKKQPLLFTKRILFYVPLGVLLCANADLIAGFDYTYEVYDEGDHYDDIPYDVYKQFRPDVSYDVYQTIYDYYEQLQKRYDHVTMKDLSETVKKDLRIILDFFDSLESDGSLIDTYMNRMPQNRLEELMYFAFADLAQQHKQFEVAIGLRMQLNQMLDQKCDK